MKPYDYILTKQIQWANRSNIKLIGSKGNRGRLAYTKKLDDNLFEPLSSDVQKNFLKGDGGELTGKPCKMQAVHSSSALSVNIFQFWKENNRIPAIASLCDFCNRNNKSPQEINFEVKFPINKKFRYSPNIDVVITNSLQSRFNVYAIECKFSEAYSREHKGIKPEYLALKEIWSDIPNIYRIAKKISPDDNKFRYLHVAQLIKHILGIKQRFGKNKFRLLYLWYDTIGVESAIHHNEINEFIEITKEDGINFHALSYQELIIRMANEHRAKHRKYVDYLSERYL